jgi:hypothetical protein
MMPREFETALRAFATHRSFQPFLVELHGGHHLLVEHPDFLSLRGHLAIYLRKNGTLRLFDCTSVIQLCFPPLLDLPASIEPVSD